MSNQNQVQCLLFFKYMVAGLGTHKQVLLFYFQKRLLTILYKGTKALIHEDYVQEQVSPPRQYRLSCLNTVLIVDILFISSTDTALKKLYSKSITWYTIPK